ncbi:uncharacterized protein (DUF58 family) [Isoptericola jiangsuensis]|uniref:Uncharacterized protein (DUF58 family) n=1 Tax=Isoptericola jiangsuensis TaxID=548579 RepID=A0A2A9EX88_9MICO|nr:DUF58 domain-containing protein [Isoptericola jiangsuensis]PFG43186.1 uncharacterized protein (DUF58 family) [Isoptericola jiangsuensis]
MSFGTTARDAARDRGLRQPDEPVWRRTPAGVGALVVGAALLTLGLLAGRADVALLGVPVLLSAAWTGRPGAWTGGTADRATTATLTSAPTAEPGRLGAVLTVDPPPGAELVQVRVAAPGHRPAELVVAARRRELTLHLSTVRTGPQPTFVADVRGHGPGGATAEDPVRAGAPDSLVLPAAMPLGRVPLPPRLRGLTGPHTSRRLGSGDELRDIHPFVPGDRLRRIDWRTTARRSADLDELYVRRTQATAEATTMLVLDSRDDVGPDLRTWRGSGPRRVDEPTSLDLARHAAASVAGAVVDAGDRVGLEDLGRRRRPLPPAAGRRHLRRVLHGLALASPLGDPSRRLRAPRLPADAVVYLFSTLLDDEVLHVVRAWREQGHRVVVVDTLPRVHPVAEEHLRIAWRVTSMERRDRVDRLVAEGVVVLPWAGADRSRAAARLEAVVRADERHHAGPPGRRTATGGGR